MEQLAIIAAIASVKAGDDTPIGMYVTIGVIALALLILAAVLSVVSKKKKK